MTRDTKESRPSVAAGLAASRPHPAITPALPKPGESGPGSEGLRVRSAIWLLSALFLLLTAATTAAADGEVGLVIEENGQVRSYCVAYSGTSISGDDLLAAAGIPHDDLGTSSGSVLCAIGNTGCFDAGNYNDCWCQCAGGGGDCVYWAFFIRDYGSGWVYSSRAFDRTSSNDGDLHAWKWGEGGPSSAPKPSDALTFESVCGHAPRGGVPPQIATATLLPTIAATQPPAAPAASAVDTTATLPPGPATLTPEVSVTFTAVPTQAIVLEEESPPAATDGNGGPAELVAFGALALVLIAGIGGATYWRRRHDG